MLIIYRLLGIILSPFIFLLLIYRTLKGKEDSARIKEKFAIYPSLEHKKLKSKPLIWLHAASVGETIVASTLISSLSQKLPKHYFLITTTTKTSGKIVEQYLNEKVFHQYVPFDISFCVKNFLSSYKPSLGIFIESEIWPNLLSYASERFPIVLVNARISEASFQKWRYFKTFIEYLLKRFTVILTQTKADYIKYKKLGAINVLNFDNLKYSQAPTIPIEDNLKQSLKQDLKIEDRHHIILAASTHPGDENFIFQAYKKLKQTHPDSLLIIAPRHPTRGKGILKIADKHNLKGSLRSANEEITYETDFYMADTLGELNMFFAIANITFIGGSFHNGGHNIIEPAHFKTFIIFGPNMSNFNDIAQDFLNQSAAKMIENENDFIATVNEVFEKPYLIEECYNNAQKVLQQKQKILDDYINKILPYIKSD